MRSKLEFLVLLQFVIRANGSGFKILALLPYFGKSHWEVSRPLLEELARRGNNVTVLSHFPRETPLKNYRDISMVGSTMSHPVHSKDFDTIGSASRLKEMKVVFRTGVQEVCEKGLRHPNVQKLLNSNDKFDLIVTEIFNTDCFLGFVHKFQAPFIAIRTAPLSPWSNYRVGNPENPAYIPNSLLGKPSRMGFWDRMENLAGTVYYKHLYASYNGECTEIARSHFGPDMPNLEDIAINTSLILVNSYFVHQYARPFASSVKEVGGLHIQNDKPLDKELEEWISSSKHGVIYFSLGSMLKSSSLSNVKRKDFLEAFAELPHRVLMKWEDEHVPEIPPNIRTFQWAPQYAVLNHSNVKLFISHAGQLSTTEAVYTGTPMIAIPAYGDQPTNAALLQERGFSITLGYSDITKEAVLQAIKRILYDPKYERQAKRMSAAIKDRLVTPLDEAVFWTEYVARHKGAPLLRSPVVDMPLYQQLLLDVIATLLIFSLCTLWIMYKIISLMSLLIKRLITTSVTNASKKTN